MIEPDVVWNIELIELLHSMKDPDNLFYIQYFMRSENTARTDVIVPVKTRINQSAPLPTQKIIMILEGAFVKGAEFIGKALFTLKSGECYNFSNIDYASLIYYRHLVSMDISGVSSSIPCSLYDDKSNTEEVILHIVHHSGLCGPNAIGESLGFERASDDPNSAGKVVMHKLVKEGYYQKLNVPDPNLELDYLESKYWLNSDSSKTSYLSFLY